MYNRNPYLKEVNNLNYYPIIGNYKIWTYLKS